MICESLTNKYGPDSKYTKDCQIRAIKDLPYEAAAQLLNYNGPPPIIIEAGIGKLYLSPTETKWEPAVKGQPSPPPLPADTAIAQSRQSVCDTCSRYESGKCQVAGCGCAGQGKPSVRFSKCPLGLWPVQA
jgi:hypothetical protein